jgi:hypothetical protein
MPSYFSITFGAITMFGSGYMLAQWLLEKKRKSDLEEMYKIRTVNAYINKANAETLGNPYIKQYKTTAKTRSASRGRSATGPVTTTTGPVTTTTKLVVPEGSSGGRLKKTRKRKGKFSKKRQLRKIRHTGKRKHRKSKK